MDAANSPRPNITSPLLPAYLADNSQHGLSQHTMSHHGGPPASGHFVVPSLQQKANPNLVPLSMLQRWPATVECPACRQATHTGISHEAGKGTHLMAVMFFFTTGVGAFIPYVCNAMKNVRHSCMKCGTPLATHHFGSSTESHLL